jgi:class 3 adenylate cyclase
MLDPEIVTAILSPVRLDGELTADQEALLGEVARGRPLKAIAASRRATPEAVNSAIEEVFLALAQGASSGRAGALRRLRMLHTAILRREEQGEILSRLLPGGLAEKLRVDAGAARRTEKLLVTVLMSDVRGYSEIAEHTDPVVLAGQLNAHRCEMNAAILTEKGTVMQYVGDAVMAVFGAPFPQPDQAARACRAAAAMHAHQQTLNGIWAAGGLEPFGLGIGISTGDVAAALLGSEERLEYTLVGDTVNLAQRLCDLARPEGTTVVSSATVERLCRRRHGRNPLMRPEACLPDALSGVELIELAPQMVKGRVGEVRAFRFGRPRTGTADAGPASDGDPTVSVGAT